MSDGEEGLSVGQFVDQTIALLEKAEALRHDAQRKAQEAAEQGRLAEFRDDPSSVVGSPEEVNKLKYQFAAMAGPLVVMAYGLDIEAAPLDDFIRTGKPHLVTAAIRVLRLIQAEILKRGVPAIQQHADKIEQIQQGTKQPLADNQFPYEYATDLHWLWGWGKRLDAWLEDDNPPNCYVWMLFRPDGLAADAMTRLSERFPAIIRQIQDHLDHAEACYAKLDEGEAASDAMDEAMDSLKRRIRTGAATIAEAQSDKTGKATQAPALDTAKQIRWFEAQRKLDTIRANRERFTTFDGFAGRLGCSQATIHKALNPPNTALRKLTDEDRQTATETARRLRKWQADASKATPRATDLNDVVADNTPQVTEPDPSDVLPDDEVEAVMTMLIQQAGPEKRAKMNALDADGRRQLAEAYNAHKRDDEPSPLDDDPSKGSQRVKHFKCV